MSILQGGSGFPFLVQPVYRYLCCGEGTNITVSSDEIPDPTQKFVIDKVQFAFLLTSIKTIISGGTYCLVGKRRDNFSAQSVTI